MKNSLESLEMHQELNDWKSDLDLFNVEIKTFLKLIEIVKDKNTGHEASDEIYSYANKLKLLKEEAIEINNSIQIRQHQLSSKALTEKKEEIFIEDDTELREDLKIFRNDLINFKHEFHNFILKWI